MSHGKHRELVLQGSPVHAEDASGLRDVAVALVQHPFDALSLELREREDLEFDVLFRRALGVVGESVRNPWGAPHPRAERHGR